jgi:hypothetical protein
MGGKSSQLCRGDGHHQLTETQGELRRRRPEALATDVEGLHGPGP